VNLKQNTKPQSTMMMMMMMIMMMSCHLLKNKKTFFFFPPSSLSLFVSSCLPLVCFVSFRTLSG
jgi:hypothetical protein